MGSPYMTLTVDLPDGTRRCEVVDVRDLLREWVTAVVKSPMTDAWEEVPEAEGRT
jgi:hypothetical protein